MEPWGMGPQLTGNQDNPSLEQRRSRRYPILQHVPLQPFTFVILSLLPQHALHQPHRRRRGLIV